jgi:hypothetical protein
MNVWNNVLLGVGIVCGLAKMHSAKPTKDRIATQSMRISEVPTTVVTHPGVASPTSLEVVTIAVATRQKLISPLATRIMRVRAASREAAMAPKPSITWDTTFIRESSR